MYESGECIVFLYPSMGGSFRIQYTDPTLHGSMIVSGFFRRWLFEKIIKKTSFDVFCSSLRPAQIIDSLYKNYHGSANHLPSRPHRPRHANDHVIFLEWTIGRQF